VRRRHRSTDTSPVSKIGYSLYPLNWFRLGLIDKYTLHYIGISSVLGLLSVAAFVLKKTMGASNLEITIFTMLMPVTSIVAIFATEWMRGRDKRAFIFWAGLIGRLPLAAMLFISQSAPFLVLSAIAFLSGAVITPAMNSLLQTNLTRNLLGKMYSVLGVLITIAVIGSTVFAGYALERDPGAYHWIRSICATAHSKTCCTTQSSCPCETTGRSCEKTGRSRFSSATSCSTALRS